MSQRPPRDKGSPPRPELRLVASKKEELSQGSVHPMELPSLLLLEKLPDEFKASPRDAGPFVASRYRSESWGVYSEDCTHDVLLRVEGQFASEDDQARYCEWLAQTLNRAIGADPKKHPFRFKPRPR